MSSQDRNFVPCPMGFGCPRVIQRKNLMNQSGKIGVGNRFAFVEYHTVICDAFIREGNTS